jgi:probable HAF family extracellular repeat protein
MQVLSPYLKRYTGVRIVAVLFESTAIRREGRMNMVRKMLIRYSLLFVLFSSKLKMMVQPLTWVLLIGVLTSPSAAQTYMVTDLGVLPDETASASIAINSHGQVVGCSDMSTTYYPCNGTAMGYAFLWDSASGMQDLGTLPHDVISAGVGISNSGEVVGYSVNSENVYHAFLWTKATGMAALPVLPGGTTNFASGINGTGLIVGSSDFKNSNGNQDAVLWTKGGGIQDLGLYRVSHSHKEMELTLIAKYQALLPLRRW